jgi:hypothetical protein
MATLSTNVNWNVPQGLEPQFWIMRIAGINACPTLLTQS